jgi:uncharacterized protein (DUF488 family)
MPDSIPSVQVAHPLVLHKLAAEGTVWTVGHSTHSFPEFLGILQAYSIETVADVRRFPGSRRHPQFGAEPLAKGLATHGIDYAWFSGLGGRRRPDLLDVEGSLWRHPSFRAYAQHLNSEEFAQGLDSLLHVAHASRTAIMCSELLWWRCHRRLIADVMVFRGWEVIHIMGTTQHSEHRLAAPVSIAPDGLSYVAPPDNGHSPCC